MNWNDLNNSSLTTSVTTQTNITKRLDRLPFRTSKSDEPQDELFRFISINLICVVSIMIIMSFCYISHVFYNKAWKPFFL